MEYTSQFQFPVEAKKNTWSVEIAAADTFIAYNMKEIQNKIV